MTRKTHFTSITITQAHYSSNLWRLKASQMKVAATIMLRLFYGQKSTMLKTTSNIRRICQPLGDPISGTSPSGLISWCLQIGIWCSINGFNSSGRRYCGYNASCLVWPEGLRKTIYCQRQFFVDWSYRIFSNNFQNPYQCLVTGNDCSLMPDNLSTSILLYWCLMFLDINTVQYNTTAFDMTLLPKFRSAHSHTTTQ